MPWVVKSGGGCPDAKPWGVFNKDTGRRVACHATQAEAEAQRRALYARVPESRTAGTLTVLRTVTPIPEELLDLPLGAPAQPPGEWFEPPPDMSADTKLTVVLDGPDRGRVYGMVAPHKTCLLSRPDECWTISDSPSGFRGAHQGETVLSDGRVIATANIGGSVRHAPLTASFTEAQDWYENTASRLMRVRYGINEHGIFAAGALASHVTARAALDIMQSPVSGDWRWRRELKDYDMAGVVLVNMPGFPLGANQPRAASAWGEPLIGTWVEVEAQVASLFSREAEMPCTECEEKAATAAVSAAQRREFARSGVAMKDGSFYIRNRGDLENAIQAFGRAKNKTAAKAHIIKRARALGLTSMLPEGWGSKAKAASATMVAVPDEEDVDEAPDFVTREEAMAMVQEALAERDTKLDERFAPIESNMATLSDIAAEALDAALGQEDAVESTA